MPDPTTLTRNQFAIKTGAAIRVVGQTLKFNPDAAGVLTMTITCKLVTPGHLQDGPGDILFDSCGIFEKAVANHFMSGTVSDLTTGLDSSKRTLLQSAVADINLLTTGIKGNHGSLAALRKKKGNKIAVKKTAKSKKR